MITPFYCRCTHRNGDHPDQDCFVTDCTCESFLRAEFTTAAAAAAWLDSSGIAGPVFIVEHHGLYVVSTEPFGAREVYANGKRLPIAASFIREPGKRFAFGEWWDLKDGSNCVLLKFKDANTSFVELLRNEDGWRLSIGGQPADTKPGLTAEEGLQNFVDHVMITFIETVKLQQEGNSNAESN